VSLSNPSRTARPARLVFLLQDLKFGGTQRQALELARRLDPGRFQVEIWLLADGNDLMPLAVRHGIPVVRLGRRKHVGPAALARLGWRLKTRNLDVLMPLTVVPNIWGRVFGRLAMCRLLSGTAAAGSRRQHERRLWPWATISLQQPAIRSVLIDSAAFRQAADHDLTEWTEYFSPPTHRAGPPGSCAWPGWCRKDHDTLLEAFSRTAQAHRGELWLLGDGPCLKRSRTRPATPARRTG
jgi:hypothetical protein